MIANNTCAHGNETAACMPRSSSASLAAGLTIFFLLLVIAAGLLMYKFHGKIRNMFLSERRRSVKKEEYIETPQADPHQYVAVTKEQPAGQAPIYENLATRANRKPSKHSRASTEPEEDLYLQCDVPDDVIYSNDPACNLSLLSYAQDEDVYIVPDAL